MKKESYYDDFLLLFMSQSSSSSSMVVTETEVEAVTVGRKPQETTILITEPRICAVDNDDDEDVDE